MRTRSGTGFVTLHLVLAAVGCAPSRAGSPPPPVVSSGDTSPRAQAIVDAADRTDDDRRIDPGRRPAELLTFLRVEPGMRVGEIAAGAGYTAELLARAVAPNGVVFAENPSVVLRGSEAQWQARLARPAMKMVVRVDREMDDPFPPEATNLDLVVINLVYHDTVYLGVDRERMNRAVFASLKKGGRYVVIDHSARPRSGLADVQRLHRVDEATVREEVARAGFALETADSFLRNPADTRDWNDSPGQAGARRGTSDRFALMFVKP
jgi:predicted methyltransferase